jgi:transcriptional regulator with XRE-family HTH domain
MPACDYSRGVGNVLRTRRRGLGFSQESFADRIGMHRAYYGALERGAKNWQLSTLIRVAVGLGLQLSQLIEAAEQGQFPRL